MDRRNRIQYAGLLYAAVGLCCVDGSSILAHYFPVLRVRWSPLQLPRNNKPSHIFVGPFQINSEKSIVYSR